MPRPVRATRSLEGFGCISMSLPLRSRSRTRRPALDSMDLLTQQNLDFTDWTETLYRHRREMVKAFRQIVAPPLIGVLYPKHRTLAALQQIAPAAPPSQPAKPAVLMTQSAWLRRRLEQAEPDVRASE